MADTFTCACGEDVAWREQEAHNDARHGGAKGEYGTTVDGVTIQAGLRVWTNNLERGEVVVSGRYRPHFEGHVRPGYQEWWFYVQVDGSGAVEQSQSRVATRWKGELA